jgi:hypothetical protein
MLLQIFVNPLFKKMPLPLVLEPRSLTKPVRSGLIVDPAYQKLGLGRRLAVLDCEIADEAGARTWVIASANSRKLFVSVGFVEVGCESVVLGEGEGGEEKVGRNWVTVREPKGKEEKMDG